MGRAECGISNVLDLNAQFYHIYTRELSQNILHSRVQHREQFLKNSTKFSDTLPKVLGQRKRNRDLSRSI